MEKLIQETPCAKPEHEVFARELAVHDNALVAYQRAYPNCKPDSARANAYRLAKHPDVARRIAELQRQRREQLRERTADLEAALAALVTADPVELVDEHGDLIPLRDLPAELRQWISVSVEITTGADGQPTRKMRASIPNKLDGLKFLAQLRGLLINRTDVTSGGRPIAPVVAPEALPADLERELRRRLLPGSLREPINAEPEPTPVEGIEDLV